MARLLARTPCEDLGLPLTLGGARLSEVDLGPVTLVSPFAGQTEAVARRLGSETPSPGRMVLAEGARLLWVGPGKMLVLGRAVPDLSSLAAIVEQEDGLAGVVLEGPAGRDILARLVPLDLRDRSFPDGATARTLLNHMTVTLTRTGADAWEVMAMRSMAATLVRELREAMENVAARAGA